MEKHEFSKRIKIDTDEQFKNDEFEKFLAEHMVGFIQCYPHYIQKKPIPHIPGEEMWIFKFEVPGDE